MKEKNIFSSIFCLILSILIVVSIFSFRIFSNLAVLRLLSIAIGSFSLFFYFIRKYRVVFVIQLLLVLLTIFKAIEVKSFDPIVLIVLVLFSATLDQMNKDQNSSDD